MSPRWLLPENAWRNGRSDQEVVDATVRANADLGILARLRRAGRVLRRDGPYEVAHPEVARPFVARVEGLASPHAGKNLAVRPNKHVDKRKRRR